MSSSEALARLIRARYDQCPAGKWPMEDSLAEFILEHAAEHGLAVVQLPEPAISQDTYQSWHFSIDGEMEVTCPADEIHVSGIGHFTVTDARDFAVALLAAIAYMTESTSTVPASVNPPNAETSPHSPPRGLEPTPQHDDKAGR